MARKLTTLTNVSTSANGVLLNPVARIFTSIGVLVAALLDRQPEPQAIGVSMQNDGSFKLYEGDAAAAAAVEAAMEAEATAEQVTSTLPSGSTKRFVWTGSGVLFGGVQKSLEDFINLVTDGEEDAANGGDFANNGPWDILIDQNTGLVTLASTAAAELSGGMTEFAQVSPQGDKWE